jgi:hemerythrin-like domain-containing protein
MSRTVDETRRMILKIAAAGGGLLAAGASPSVSDAIKQKQVPGREGEVTPTEDLMREHGVLKRVLLIYRESIRRLDSSAEVPSTSLSDAIGIIRRFIEDYHEKLEEEHVFPRLRKAGKLPDLVDVLASQHRAGRVLTDRAMHLATAKALKVPNDRRTLKETLRLFVRMYEPHEAREDTVLFPAFRTIVAPQEFDALGDAFEKKEHELFGREGFEGIVNEVARIEREFGIYDLSQFTPKV